MEVTRLEDTNSCTLLRRNSSLYSETTLPLYYNHNNSNEIINDPMEKNINSITTSINIGDEISEDNENDDSSRLSPQILVSMDTSVNNYNNNQHKIEYEVIPSDTLSPQSLQIIRRGAAAGKFIACLK